MLYLLAIVPVVIVLAFFLTQRRDPAWDRFRQRFQAKTHKAKSDQPIDPNFQFDDEHPNDRT